MGLVTTTRSDGQHISARRQSDHRRVDCSHDIEHPECVGTPSGPRALLVFPCIKGLGPGRPDSKYQRYRSLSLVPHGSLERPRAERLMECW